MARLAEEARDDPVLLVRATIPGLPPSVNHTYVSAKGRVFKTRDAKEWQKMATLLLRSARKARTPYAGKASYLLILRTGGARRMDCDNREKAIQDCLGAAGVIGDDSQIWTHMTRRMSSPTGRDETEILVWAGSGIPGEAVPA